VKELNTTSSGKNPQIDITCLQNGKIWTPVCYYEIPTGRKEEPRLPTEETFGHLA
jgi:hypothetical protein